jgi:peptide/nickel transport system substrate-binding protein
MRLKSAAAVAAVLALGVAAACGGSETPSERSRGSESTSTAKPPGGELDVILRPDAKGPAPAVDGAQQGGTITVLTAAAPETFDPTRSYYIDTLSVGRLIHRTLTALYLNKDGKYELVPDLATDLGKANDDFTEFTFKIKPGQKFEDGTPITSKDFAYAIKRSFATEELAGGPTYQQIYFLDGDKYKGPFKPAAQGGGEDYKGVETPDDETLIIKMAKPFPDLPYYLTFPLYSPIPQAKETKENYGNKPVSTGPYKVKSYQKGKSLVLDKNPNWDGNSDPARHQYADGFDFKFSQEPLKLQEQLIADNGVDKTSITYDNVDSSLLPKIQGKAGVEERLITGPGTCTSYLYIDTSKITNVDVRKAIGVAYPYDNARKAAGESPLTYAPGTTTYAPVVPGWQNFDVSGTGAKGNGDPERAKAMLEKAGAAGFELSWPYSQDNPISVALSAARKEGFEKAGFKVKAIPMPREQVRAALDDPKAPINIRPSGWCPDWPSAATIFPAIFDGRLIALNPTSLPNKSLLNEKKVNDEIDRISALPIDQAPAEWAKLDKMMMEEFYPVVPYDYAKNAFLTGSGVGGVVNDPYAGGPDFSKLFVKK